MVRSGGVTVGVAWVFHVRNVPTITAIHGVSHGLGSTIGQQNMVITGGMIAVPSFFLAEVYSIATIIYSISVVVDGCGMGISPMVWCMVHGGVVNGGVVNRSVVGGAMVEGGVVSWAVVDDGVVSDGNSGQRKNDESLKFMR